MNRRVLLWTLLLLQGVAAAAPTPAPARPRLKMALFDVPPYAESRQGQVLGHYVELAHELLGTAGFELEIQVLPFARLPVALSQGEADLSLGFRTPALDRVAIPVAAVALVDLVLVARKGWPLQRLDQLRGANVGRARGGCGELAGRSDLRIQWRDVSQFGSGLRMLALGRLDALCLTREVLRHELLRTGLKADDFGSSLLVQPQTVWLFARHQMDEASLAQLKRALRKRPLLRFD